MQHKSPFTAENVWRGGHYELLIEANEDSSEQVCSLLRALWSHPSLDGCFLRNDNGPSAQLRVQPCENAVAGHLYGLALLPNKRMVAL